MNPWIVVRIQVVKRQHRGAAHSRQYGLSGEISLLSLAYLHSIMSKLVTQTYSVTMANLIITFNL
jgi:hypothetical protein